MLSLTDPLSTIKGLGPATNKKLAKLKIYTIQDLLLHFPYRYEDFSQVTPIKNLTANNKATIQGKIQTITTRHIWRSHLSITQALISDQSGTIKSVWFNQPYLSNSLKQGDTIVLSGWLKQSKYGLQLEQPSYDKLNNDNLHTARLVPYYHLTSGLNHHLLRQLMAKIKPAAEQLTDWLPEEIIKKFKLPNFKTVVRYLHWPNQNSEIIQGRQRLVFNEFYLINLQNQLLKIKRSQQTAPIITFRPETKNFVDNLPYHLTADQKIAAWEIIKDLGRAQPMFRLLQGDVGSGKTVVAGLAALNCALNNWQTALLAPTEVLAIQHFDTLNKLLADFKIKLALLTQGKSLINNQNINKIQLKKLLALNKIDIIIGTQALLQPTVKIPKLGLVIVDEQHRFGVEQRQYLTAVKNKITPHFLSLSATPIPRSLALALYGNLELSLIKTRPAGRQPVITRLLTGSQRNLAYNLTKQEIKKGHKVFIICPLIDENDNEDTKAVLQEHARLQKEIFPQIKLGLLHGKLNSAKKQQALTDFKNGTTPILVCTSVIEVGVDIPDATVMIIEGAERFGLAQLHQFRGRIGRANLPSYCLLITDNTNDNERLSAMTKYSNGFALAEFDLKTRGPGSLTGRIQSGFNKIKYWDLVNSQIIKTIQQATAYTLSLDSSLNAWPKLKNKVMAEEIHPE